jgi:hypothetical protein
MADVQMDADGTVYVTDAEGNLSIINPDGTTLVQQPDGSIAYEGATVVPGWSDLSPDQRQQVAQDVSSSSGINWQNILNGVGQVVQAVYQDRQNARLFQINSQRVARGLPPVAANAVYATPQGAVATDFGKIALGVGALIVLGLGVFAFSKKR